MHLETKNDFKYYSEVVVVPIGKPYSEACQVLGLL